MAYDSNAINLVFRVALPGLRLLVDSTSPWRPGIISSLNNVGLVDETRLRQIFLRVLRFLRLLSFHIYVFSFIHLSPMLY